MNGAEFSECASYTDLFTSQLEIGEIFLYITQGDKKDEVGEPSSKKNKREDVSEENKSLLSRSKRTIIWRKSILPITYNDLICSIRNKKRCEVTVLALKKFHILGFVLMEGAIPKFEVFDDKNEKIAMGSNENFPKPIFMQQNQAFTFVFDEPAPNFYRNTILGKVIGSTYYDTFLIVSAKFNVISALHVAV